MLSGYLSNMEVSSALCTGGLKGGETRLANNKSQSVPLYHLCLLMSSTPALFEASKPLRPIVDEQSSYQVLRLHIEMAWEV